MALRAASQSAIRLILEKRCSVIGKARSRLMFLCSPVIRLAKVIQVHVVEQLPEPWSPVMILGETPF